jgi:hypothetical protein
VRVVVGVAIVLVAAFGGVTTRAATPPEPHVLLIGDSIATGMQWYDDAASVLERRLDIAWQVAVCRRLTAQSCTFQDETPPTLLALVPTLGRLPPVVVVEMGYNDNATTFAEGVEESIQSLLAHGARHILWLTLREVRHPYVQMNDVLAAAAKRHSQLTLVDWNAYSRDHPSWFQSDGMHLVDAGGVAMATLVHLAVDEVARPLRIAASPLPPVRAGAPYSARLRATGGELPYRWQLLGKPPRGLHLLANGRLYGRTASARRVTVTARVVDAEGQAASRRLTL